MFIDRCQGSHFFFLFFVMAIVSKTYATVCQDENLSLLEINIVDSNFVADNFCEITSAVARDQHIGRSSITTLVLYVIIALTCDVIANLCAS